MRWPAEAIWEAIAPLLPGFTVEILPEIDSTNTELMRRARAGQAEPVLLVAEMQTAGRGRLGRGWHSAPGASLTFSLGLPLAPADWSGLSLAVGVSLAGSLHPAIGLKWPNDLWWEQRKLAGILIETAAIGSQRHAVIGIGVNIAPPPKQEGLATPAAALQELMPGIDAPGAKFDGVNLLPQAEFKEGATRRDIDVVSMTALVLDIKTGRPADSHHKQVANYIHLLRELGLPKVSGHLFYVRNGALTPVDA